MNDLHKLMPGGFSNCPKKRYKNVLDNPHLVDYYFSFLLNEFLKLFSTAYLIAIGDGIDMNGNHVVRFIVMEQPSSKMICINV
jgi:hypothetical protein